VIAVAVLLPALALALATVRTPIDLVDVMQPLAAAAGVVAGMWAASAVLERGGRAGALLGLAAAASVGLLVAALVALPAYQQPGSMDPMMVT
jgi:hypothetical protein